MIKNRKQENITRFNLLCQSGDTDVGKARGRAIARQADVLGFASTDNFSMGVGRQVQDTS